ncbi:hypothetical protein BH09VER1_BH09VER1_28430 [soil metagenome]
MASELPITAIPLDEAVRSISDKTPIGSTLRSIEWADVPLALRQRAQFSAGIESVRLLQAVQDKLRGSLALQPEGVRNGTAFIDRSSFIADMRKIAVDEGIFVDPLKKGGLQDITSRKRLGMIFDIQDEQAKEYARWKAEQDPDVLAAFPAQVFIRLEERAQPRKWRERWSAAGGTFHNGQMIALKGDPIWRKISRFGTPFPPFDFNSGMGLEDIDRATAEKLGLIKPGETPVPAEDGFNDELQASVKGLSPEIRAQLKKSFGDQIDIAGDVVRWTGQPAAKKAAPVPTAKQAPTPIAPAAPQPVAGALQPSGPAVSEAMQITVTNAATKKAIKSAQTAIDAVHGDGLLTPIPITGKVPRNARGVYSSYDDSAVLVGIKSKIDGAEFTVAHEVGHWLDHIGIPSRGKFASQSGGELFAEFWQAVEASAAYQKLDEVKTIKFREYFKRGREVWARAYSQFIAKRSGNAAMLARLEKILAGQADSFAQTQWEDQDFAPIEKAIEGILKKQGWMK